MSRPRWSVPSQNVPATPFAPGNAMGWMLRLGGNGARCGAAIATTTHPSTSTSPTCASGLPFSGVKLDRSLTRRLPFEHRARAEAKRVIASAHARGMRVTAEGIADGATWDAARAVGADQAQGFAVGRPMPVE